MLMSLAWRNIWRQPVRTALTLLSMALAAMLLVFMLSFQLGVYDTMKGNALRLLDGFAQIQPEGYAEDPDIEKVIADPDAVAAKALDLPGVTAVAPRATGYVILANGVRSYGAAVIGVDPQKETTVTSLPGTVREGRYLQPGDKDAVVVGSVLARNLKLKLGDRMTLIGSGRDGSVAADSLEVVGLFDTGMPDLDRQIAQMPLSRFDETFAMQGAVNYLALIGPTLGAVDAEIPALRAQAAGENLAVRDWAELQPAVKQGIDLDFSTGILFYVSLVVVVIFIILNTLLMSVLERTREFGMLLAIGMRPSRAGRMVWIELVLLAVIGNVIGIVLGGGLALYFQSTGIAFEGLEGMLAQFGLSDKLYPVLSLTSAFAGPLAIVLSVIAVGIIPYRHILKLNPVDAVGTA